MQWQPQTIELRVLLFWRPRIQGLWGMDLQEPVSPKLGDGVSQLAACNGASSPVARRVFARCFLKLVVASNGASSPVAF